MLNLRIIHPHARLWIITAIILGLILVLKTPTGQQFVSPPQGKVIAYYHNDYQRYAIDQLTKQDNLEQYPCLYELWTKESLWNPKSLNKSSKALGIAQLLPSTWKLIKVKPTINGYEQVDAGLKYIDRHYGKGNICKAYAHHLAKNWY
jgi:hypothetical protein